MKYVIKGGIWKNCEDEILKVFIMKYGLNQWDRISSLLHRKSAKQCKQRWYQWLDPNIKKTEWTKEEDEKLLHLARVLPSQWRTIAPHLGRTPTQCHQRYQYLIDLAQGKQGGDFHELQKLRPGEMDPNPETKPARPDPIDMDQDQKQMLAEVRVRLANTKGKKAKRKERQKVIQEARRLAQLQKVRELKAAGVENILTANEMNKFKKKKKLDQCVYRTTPDLRTPLDFVQVPGPEEEPEPNFNQTNIHLQTLQGQRRDVEQQRRLKEDSKKLKKMKQRDMERVVAMRKIIKQAANPLQLPPAKLTEKQLQAFIRGEEARGRDSHELFVQFRQKLKGLLSTIPKPQNEVTFDLEQQPQAEQKCEDEPIPEYVTQSKKRRLPKFARAIDQEGLIARQINTLALQDAYQQPDSDFQVQIQNIRKPDPIPSAYLEAAQRQIQKQLQQMGPVVLPKFIFVEVQSSELARQKLENKLNQIISANKQVESRHKSLHLAEKTALLREIAALVAERREQLQEIEVCKAVLAQQRKVGEARVQALQLQYKQLLCESHQREELL